MNSSKTNAGVDWEAAMQDALAIDAAREGVVLPSLLDRVRNGSWLDAQSFPPLKWMVPGLVAEGFGLVVGPPKLGKSWFVLGLGLAVACGGRALGRIPVQPRPVLYAALEDGDRRMQDRCRKLMAGEPIPAGFEYFTDATPAEIDAMVPQWLAGHPDGLVMIDTLARVMPREIAGENAYQRDYRVGGWLKAMADARPGSALLVVHHTRKAASGDWMDSTSGTQGLNGSADYTVALERARGDGNALLKVSGRDVIEGEYAVTMTAGSWALDGDSLAAAAATARDNRTAQGVGDRMAEVVALVNRTPAGVRAEVIATALGIDKDSAGRYLRRAADAGRIDRTGRGLFKPLSEVSEVSATILAFPGIGSDTPDATDTPSGEPTCPKCGQPLNPAVIADGFTTCPTCGEVDR